MRILPAALFLSVVGACADAPPPAVDRIELRVSGWSAVDISVSRQGKSSYHLSEPLPDGKSGTFSLSPQRFDELRKRLEPYRKTAVPFSEKSAREFILESCPKGVPFTYDTGAVWVHWVGPHSNQHFIADLGCDADKHAVRNEDLLAIVQSLPVPLNW